MGSLLKTTTHDAWITGEFYAPAVGVSTNHKLRSHLFTYFFRSFGPTSALYTLPSASAATPSPALVLVKSGRMRVSGSGMNDFTEPSFALPMRMPRFHPSWLRATDSDSESVT